MEGKWRGGGGEVGRSGGVALGRFTGGLLRPLMDLGRNCTQAVDMHVIVQADISFLGVDIASSSIRQYKSRLLGKL